MRRVAPSTLLSLALLLADASISAPAAAQTQYSAMPYSVSRSARVLDWHPPVPGQEREPRSGAEAFGIEWLGATLGSAAGFGLAAALTGDCGEDLACIINGFSLSLLTSSAGAAGGGYVAGNLVRTQPSAVGSIIGALVGAAAGVGTVHLVSEDLDLTHSDFLVGVTYTINQGLFTALGSRVFADFR